MYNESCAFDSFSQTVDVEFVAGRVVLVPLDDGGVVALVCSFVTVRPEAQAYNIYMYVHKQSQSDENDRIPVFKNDMDRAIHKMNTCTRILSKSINPIPNN